MYKQQIRTLSKAIVVLMLVALVAYALPGPVFSAWAAPGDITRVSVSSSGLQANAYSRDADISADGRYVVFWSGASNLVEGDTNGAEEIFLHDLQSGKTTRVSVDSNGAQADNGSFYPVISGDGRFSAFMSDATNLVSGDTNGFSDIFLHDRQTGNTIRVSVSSNGAQANNISDSYVSISSDGRFIVFDSDATNLVSGDTNDFTDIFIYDRLTAITERVSLDSHEAQANGGSSNASISADGRFVAFSSSANNLVNGDTNNHVDIFIRDRAMGLTTRVSVNSSGVEADRASSDPAISGDGRYVTFSSVATNLFDEEPYGYPHVFVHDRATGMTTLASTQDGYQMVGWSTMPDISADGRYIAFEFDDRSDGLPYRSIYIHDRLTGLTRRVSTTGGGEDYAFGPTIASDGRYVAFASNNSHLVPGDTNGESDVFLRELAVAAPMVKTYQSVGVYDGWIIESGEDSETGDKLDERGTTLQLGDASNDQQYRSILHFATASIPDNAVITGVTLRIKRQGIVGDDPFATHGDILVDVHKPHFDTAAELQAADFQAPASLMAAGKIKDASGDLWYTAVLDAAAFPYINLIGPTQFRLRFALDDNDDNGQDFLKFYSGDAGAADQPVLTVEYLSISTFSDVPADHWAWSYIERLYAAGVTGGCAASPLQYCPENTVTRDQMAVFLERGIHGSAYAPPAVGTGTGFNDVLIDHWAAAWIKQLAAERITGGCGGGNYCPGAPVTRGQMAVFLLKAKHGSSYGPPAVGSSTGFSDVPTNYWAAAWIKQLAAEGITGGCATNLYCPEGPVTRAQMAVFLVKTFNLP